MNSSDSFVNIIWWVAMITFVYIVIIRPRMYINKCKKTFLEFERKINNRSFTKRIIVYDFLPNSIRKRQGMEYVFSAGIWLDYQNDPKQLALRLDNESTDLIDIPFKKIQGFEILEDGYTKFSGGAVGYGGISVFGGKSEDISKGLQVRIVTGDINSGTQAYFLDLSYSNYRGKRYNKSDPEYKAIQECARSIGDECTNIIRHSDQY